MSSTAQAVIAVSVAELREFGCPHCGYRSGYTPISGGGTAAWICGSGECGKTSCVLADGATKSTIGFGDFYPELQPHPRKGTPSHGQPDKKPDGGGEFFRSRGIGLDTTPGCFVCEGSKCLRNNIAAYVQNKESGERVVALFSKGARLDYREYEPDHVQVKIGACDSHLPNLERLHSLVSDGIITKERIAQSVA